MPCVFHVRVPPMSFEISMRHSSSTPCRFVCSAALTAPSLLHRSIAVPSMLHVHTTLRSVATTPRPPCCARIHAFLCGLPGQEICAVTVVLVHRSDRPGPPFKLRRLTLHLLCCARRLPVSPCHHYFTPALVDHLRLAFSWPLFRPQFATAGFSSKSRVLQPALCCLAFGPSYRICSSLWSLSRSVADHRQLCPVLLSSLYELSSLPCAAGPLYASWGDASRPCDAQSFAREFYFVL